MPSLSVDRRGWLKLSERAIEQQLVDALEAHGWRVLRTNKFCSGNAVVVQGAVEVGIPDLQARRKFLDCVFVSDGNGGSYLTGSWRLVWIEVKRPGENLNEKQRTWWAAHPDEDRRIARGIEDVEDLLR
jgi:hypothetical protein